MNIRPKYTPSRRQHKIKRILGRSVLCVLLDMECASSFVVLAVNYAPRVFGLRISWELFTLLAKGDLDLLLVVKAFELSEDSLKNLSI